MSRYWRENYKYFQGRSASGLAGNALRAHIAKRIKALKIFIVLALLTATFTLRSFAQTVDTVKDQVFANQIVEGTLKQVEALARALETLDQFGKSTLEQSATILDMGEAAAPVLTRWARSGRRDWKTRYWIADMFAYVGTAKSTEVLLKVARDKRENRAVRMRALESITEVWKKYRSNTKKLQSDLETILSKTQDPKLRDKIQQTILEIDI